MVGEYRRVGGSRQLHISARWSSVSGRSTNLVIRTEQHVEVVQDEQARLLAGGLLKQPRDPIFDGSDPPFCLYPAHILKHGLYQLVSISHMGSYHHSLARICLSRSRTFASSLASEVLPTPLAPTRRRGRDSPSSAVRRRYCRAPSVTAALPGYGRVSAAREGLQNNELGSRTARSNKLTLLKTMKPSLSCSSP